MRNYKKYKLICKYCGKEFETTNKNGKFCSKSCCCYYTHENMTPEKKKARSEKLSIKTAAYFASLSEEDKEKRRQQAISVLINNSKSKEVQEKRINSYKETWSKKSPEELEENSRIHSEARKRYFATTPPEELKAMEERRVNSWRETVSKRTDADWDEIKQHISDAAKTRNWTDESEKMRLAHMYETRANWSDDQKRLNSQHCSEGQRKMSPEVRAAKLEKELNTKKLNHTFNSSKPEEDFYNNLCALFGTDNVLRQYKDKRYPFACDFYIRPLDLFIELNLHWTHGGRPFNENDQACLDILDEWCEKAQTSKYIENAINTWTKRDVEKRNTAKLNNLNYVEFFSFEEAIQYYETFA